jgi:hypothetical protein
MTRQPETASAEAIAKPKTRGWVSGIPYLLAWLPGAFAAFYLKYNLIYIPRPRQTIVKLDLHSLGVLSPLPLYRTDVPLAFLVIPALLLLIVILLPQRWRTPLVGVFSIFWVTVSYLSYVSYVAVARLLSFSLLGDALVWAREDPAAVRHYFTPGGLLAAAALVASVVGLCCWGAWRSRRMSGNARAERRWRRAALAWALAVAAATAILWVPRSAPSPLFRSIFATSLETLVESRQGPESEFSRLTPPELVRAYRALTNAPSPTSDSRYWGKAQGSDVLFIVLETGAFRFMPINENLDDLPNLRRLREKSFLAVQHHTAIPFTFPGRFSIFNSWYPSNRPCTFFQQYINLRVPGIMRTLAARGYDTGAYCPPGGSKFSDREFELMGFQHRVVAPAPANSPFGFEDRWAMDRDALRLLLHDLDGWERQGQRFAAAFLPECGHFPLPNRAPDGHPYTIVESGRAVMALQDAFLGELVSALEARHRLDQTLIVVTADHGVRWEDPSLPMGMIDEYSFHVPLLLYAPQALDHAETVSWITSHVDIGPTILDLLGVERDRDSEQGSPLWDSRLKERSTFFLAKTLCEASGYYRQGRFYMSSDLDNSVYQSDKMHFAADDTVLPGIPLHAEVTTTIRRFDDLMEAWATARWPLAGEAGGKVLSAGQ